MPECWLVLINRKDAGPHLYELLLATRNTEAAVRYHAEKLVEDPTVILARQVLPHNRPPDSASTIEF